MMDHIEKDIRKEFQKRIRQVFEEEWIMLINNRDNE